MGCQFTTLLNAQWKLTFTLPNGSLHAHGSSLYSWILLYRHSLLRNDHLSQPPQVSFHHFTLIKSESKKLLVKKPCAVQGFVGSFKFGKLLCMCVFLLLCLSFKFFLYICMCVNVWQIDFALLYSSEKCNIYF